MTINTISTVNTEIGTIFINSLGGGAFKVVDTRKRNRWTYVTLMNLGSKLTFEITSVQLSRDYQEVKVEEIDAEIQAEIDAEIQAAIDAEIQAEIEAEEAEAEEAEAEEAEAEEAEAEEIEAAIEAEEAAIEAEEIEAAKEEVAAIIKGVNQARFAAFATREGGRRKQDYVGNALSAEIAEYGSIWECPIVEDNFTEEEIENLARRYAHLNPGMIRMNIANKLRHIIKG